MFLRHSSRFWWVTGLVIVVCIAAIYLIFIRPAMRSRAAKAQLAQTRGVSVTAEAAKKGDMTVYVTGLGTVTPVNTITVKTRVDGQLMEVRYKEGQDVDRGDVLAIIDPRPFEVLLLQAEGQMARDEALLSNALIDLERYRVLWKQDSIPKQQLDTQEALVRQYKGTVKADRGVIENAKLQLTYCRITAPQAGRIGLRLVDPGNIVHVADTTGLLVITQLKPITVVFTLPESSLTKVHQAMQGTRALAVAAYDRDLKNIIADGTLLAIDNQVDVTTGTVKLRASFPNTRNELYPNQFVNARLVVDVKHDVVIIPAAAIQRGPNGTFVFVVGSDNTASIRPIEVDVVESGQASINKGLNPGELVVTDGAERLKSGARVEVKAPRKAPAQRVP